MYRTNKEYQWHWRNQRKTELGTLGDTGVSEGYRFYLLYYLTSISQSLLKIFNSYRFQPGQNLQIISVLERKRHAQKSGSWGRAGSEKTQTNLNGFFRICFNPHSDTILLISCCFLETGLRLNYFWQRACDLKKQVSLYSSANVHRNNYCVFTFSPISTCVIKKKVKIFTNNLAQVTMHGKVKQVIFFHTP